MGDRPVIPRAVEFFFFFLFFLAFLGFLSLCGQFLFSFFSFSFAHFCVLSSYLAFSFGFWLLFNLRLLRIERFHFNATFFNFLSWRVNFWGFPLLLHSDEPRLKESLSSFRNVVFSILHERTAEMVRYGRVLRFNEICELKAILARCKE